MFKILIVDDDPSLRTLMTRMVNKLGHTTCEATNGLEGERTALEWQPDAILMDVMMPLQDGYATCVHLRQKGYSGYIMVISGVSTMQGHSEARLYGADAFLQKPISFSVLEKHLNAHFQVHTVEA